MSENTIDIRIFGVPERMDWIEKNKAILQVPDDKVVIDYNHDGCVPTSKRTWAIPSDCSHVLVLADDVELCSDFKHYCQMVVDAHPDDIIFLFPIQFLRRDMIRVFPTKSPYVETKLASGAGIIMPSKYVEPCLASWQPDARCDDSSIYVWAVDNGIHTLTTLPALLQHIGDQSYEDPSRHIGGTVFYDPDPSYANWENSYVTPWTNIVRR